MSLDGLREEVHGPALNGPDRVGDLPVSRHEHDWKCNAALCQRDLQFEAHSGHTTTTIDSKGLAGPSPIDALALALAGCMAVDVADIVTKGRHPMRGLTAVLTAERAAEPPRRTPCVLIATWWKKCTFTFSCRFRDGNPVENSACSMPGAALTEMRRPFR